MKPALGAPRVDAQASDSRAGVGVGCLQQTETERFGSGCLRGSVWMSTGSISLVSTRKDDKPALVIASLEALAILLALKAFYGETPPEERSTVQVLPTWTDNKGNGSILNKLMCTRYPVSAILMELAVHMKAMEQKTAVNWTPREANREADASANGDSSGFDPAKEIKFDLSHRHWRILPRWERTQCTMQRDVELSHTRARNGVADDLRRASR